MSGYCNCACRDCFEIAIASNDPTDDPALCHACEEAQCDPHGNEECQAEGAYGIGEEEEQAS